MNSTITFDKDDQQMESTDILHVARQSARDIKMHSKIPTFGAALASSWKDNKHKK